MAVQRADGEADMNEEQRTMDTEVITALRRFEDHWTSERLHESIALLQTNGILTIPDLLIALSDPDPNIQLLVIEILAELDPIDASLPALTNALEDPDRIVRIAAVEPVTRFGKKAIAAVPILEGWFDDEKEYVRIAAARAIGQIDPNKIPEVMPVLIDGLGSSIHLDQLDAAAALGDFGEAGSGALPMLGKMLTDRNSVTRSEAASTISKITGDPTVELTVVVASLRATNWLDRYGAAEHLGCMGAVAAPALPYLRRALDDEDAAVRTAVETAIERAYQAARVVDSRMALMPVWWGLLRNITLLNQYSHQN